MDLVCPFCSHDFKAKERVPGWTGDNFRITAKCPECGDEFQWRFSPKGFVSDKAPVRITDSTGEILSQLEDYDSCVEEANAFARKFEQVWRGLPEPVSSSLRARWLEGVGSPHIWFVHEAGGQKWTEFGMSMGNGLSLYFHSELIPRLPDQLQKVVIAHEIGHSLFGATGEPIHCRGAATTEEKQRAEWLVWQLVDAWGYDQQELFNWMDCYLQPLIKGQGLRFLDEPIRGEFVGGRNVMGYQEIELKNRGMGFPPKYEAYLGNAN